jgi:hypothetical protein
LTVGPFPPIRASVSCAHSGRPVALPSLRAWLPVAVLSHDDEIELDERRAVKTTPTGVVARVWLPVAFEDL